MTDLAAAPTERTDDALQARLAQLQQRRTPKPKPTPDTDAERAPTRPARAHPALGSRIAAASLGMATMLGLVGAMGFVAQRSATATPPAEVPTPAPQVVIVHRPATAPSASSTSSDLTASSPIPLTAQPTVHQAPAAPAPVARTNASR